MSSSDTELKRPPWQQNAEGKTRCVGVELEMNGLDLDSLAGQVAGLLDLAIQSDGRYERRLTGDPAGDWMVELDYRLLKKIGREKRANKTLADQVNRSAEDAFAWAAETLVPMEIVSPPLPLNRLNEIESLIPRLREAGAKGTSDRAINAFGMQLNPDLPSHDASMIASFLKAFVCLYDWLFIRSDIDISRRITTYIDPFPAAYVKKLLESDYWPDLATLIDDYLAENPTRNRALDMLPLFMFLDEARVRAIADDPLIKARPTFHYRLPDCRIDDADWGFHVAWNDWIEIERLAADEDRLQACCKAYLDFLNSPLKRLFSQWAEAVEAEWLDR